MTIVFLGSFQHYSALTLKTLIEDPNCDVTAVITTPPSPAVGKKPAQPNPVDLLAREHDLTVFTPNRCDQTSLNVLIEMVGVPDLLLTAGYGKLLPTSWLNWPHQAALNLHFSLLPAYRGANPAEWALLANETQTGVTLIEMSPEFDTGNLVALQSLPITTIDTRTSLYEKLYTIAGQLAVDCLPIYTGATSPTELADTTTLFSPSQPQPSASPTPYAHRLTKEDGYVEWKAIQAAMNGQSVSLKLLSPKLQQALSWHNETTEVAVTDWPLICRALYEYPNLWSMVTTTKGQKRLKVISCEVNNDRLQLITVQLAGQTEANWNQIKNGISGD